MYGKYSILNDVLQIRECEFREEEKKLSDALIQPGLIPIATLKRLDCAKQGELSDARS
jgi:hypothetical protein